MAAKSSTHIIGSRHEPERTAHNGAGKAPPRSSRAEDERDLKELLDKLDRFEQKSSQSKFVVG